MSRIWAAGGSAFSRAALESDDEGAEVLFEQVVAEVHHEVVGAEEVPRDQHAVRQPERCILWQEGERDAEPRSVAERLADLVTGLADDHADVLDPRVGHRLDPIEQDRRVGDRDELLGAWCG